MAMLFRAKYLYALAAVVLIAGCANFTYYLQSVRGQLDIWSRQQDIETVLERDDTPQALREKLARVLEIREFASSALALPENRSYRLYANLERPFAVWNVFAAPEFSILPREWCFAFAGCVKYRGYFEKPNADAFAAEVAGEGRTSSWAASPRIRCSAISRPGPEYVHQLSSAVPGAPHLP